jgi:hypothetical protein
MPEQPDVAAEEEDFPGIPDEDADEYEAEVLLDENDGIEP